MGRFVYWIAPLWAAVVSVYLLFVPTHITISKSAASGSVGADVRSDPMTGSESVFAVQGWAASFAFVIPVVISTFPMFGRSANSRRLISYVAAAALASFCVASLASIGLFYIPSLTALVFQALSP
jgi:hypothetical protein